MSENKLPIFKRNKYFKGKLLTAADFQLEQDYFLNRRNFFNSLYYGGGVVSGFQVTKKDKETLTVTKGAAVDYAGRDIVAGCETDIKFSHVPKDGRDHVYLCLKYKESKEEKTFIPSEMSQDDADYNNITDSYEFYFQDEGFEPEKLFDEINGYNLYFDRKTIFSSEDFIISQSVPRYANILSQIEIGIDVIKLKNTPSKLSFSYTLESKNVKSDKKECLSVLFDEKLHLSSQKYTVTIPALVLEGMSADEPVTIAETDFFVKNGDVVIAEKPQNKDWNVKKIEPDIKKYLRDLYMAQDIEELLAKLNGFELYLAKIYFAKEGSGYIISDIQNVPFDQYVDNVRLQKLLKSVANYSNIYNADITEERVINLISASKDYMQSKVARLIKQYEKLLTANPKVSSGVAQITVNYPPVTCQQARDKIRDEIDLIDKNETISYANKQKRYNLTELLHKYERLKPTDVLTSIPEELTALQKTNVFYSGAINHKLGGGYVHISCAVTSSNKAYSGNPAIFSGSGMPDMEIGAEQNMEAGNFIIGVRLRSPTTITGISVEWTAVKESSGESAFDKFDKNLIVWPPVYSAKCGDGQASITFVCKKLGVPVKNISWKSQQNECTPPDANGKFILPSKNGIYELTATAEGSACSAFVCIYGD